VRILVLGASGMLGHTAYRLFAGDPRFQVFGSIRSETARRHLPEHSNATLVSEVDVDSVDSLLRAFAVSRPDVVINCVGIVKQLKSASDPLVAIPMNSILPHRLARIAAACGARLVHVSTDCVFTGGKGNYAENDMPDALDLYGRSKLMGEVDYPNAITLRTSIIGPEMVGAGTGLIGWFLNASGKVKGFRRAVFSGFPTVALARIIRDQVLPHPDMHGVYHVSAEPIDKFTLLQLVQRAWDKNIDIAPDDTLVIDRSLNSDRFRAAVGFTPSAWPELIQEMRAFG
jgi:dTDP-4-dehydrorhamnose reductase